MIGTVMFDGASEGKPWVDVAPDIQDFFLNTIGFGPGVVAGGDVLDRHGDRARRSSP